MCYNSLMELAKIKEILNSYDAVTNALLFGSYAKGIAKSMSDIDIAIQTREEMDLFTIGEIIANIESAIERRVDLVVLNDLYKKAPLLAFNIYQKHKVLFIKDKEAYDSFKENALHFYLDFKHIIDEQNRAFSQRVADGTLAKIKTA